MKVTVVGAGNVGASCAEYLAIKKIASNIVLLDIKEGLAEGKALDLSQTSTTLGFNSRIIGVTNNYDATSESDVIVITSGIPRKPGMTREELIGINAGIVKSVTTNILKYSPDAVIVIVSNPMDTMTYLAIKSAGIPKNKIYCDYAGFSKYDSIVRMKKVFQQKEIIIISQKFHIERAVYIARRNGIKAYAYPSKDVPGWYSPYNKYREFLARVKAVFEVVINREPIFLGDKVLVN